MTRCSPEKVKSEGLLAGLAKWTMDKSDWKDSSTNEAGTEGVDGIARIPSWISRDIQVKYSPSSLVTSRDSAITSDLI